MSVDRDEVRRIAELAKLRFDDDEADRLADEMTRILEHAERLRGLAAEDEEVASKGAHARDDGVAPVSDVARRTQDDGVTGAEDGGRSDTLALEPDPLVRDLADFAPSMRDGFFVVPPPPGVADPDA